MEIPHHTRLIELLKYALVEEMRRTHCSFIWELLRNQGKIYWVSLAVSFTCPTPTSGVAAVVSLFIIIQYPGFDAHFINIPTKAINCCQTSPGRIVKKQIYWGDSRCILYGNNSIGSIVMFSGEVHHQQQHSNDYKCLKWKLHYSKFFQ